jgi:hypothetical protein
MARVHVEPWFRAGDYERLKRLVPDYPHWADSFNAWLEGARKRIEHNEGRGLTVAQPIVDADEFVVWCGASGQPFRNRALRAFTEAKARSAA